MADPTPVQGELQLQVLAALWRRGASSVEDVRGDLPGDGALAYTTVQTVLNRLVDRGLLERKRDGNAFRYWTRLSEAEYLERSIDTTLSGASEDARQTVLARLLGRLRDDELVALRRRSADLEQRGGR